jgi:general secretion pathway protein F
VNAGLHFSFKALRQDGTIESGVIGATDRDSAVAVISRRGAFVTEISPVAVGSRRRIRIGSEDLALGLRALATLLGSGIPLARAMSVLHGLLPAGWLSALPDIRHRIEQGDSLGSALAASGLPFPSHVIGIIQAGEVGSGLSAAVENCAQLLEATAANRTTIRNALAYPLILLVTGFATITLLVEVVLPRFATLLADYGQTIPLITRLVLTAGAVGRTLFIPGLFALALTVAIWRSWVAQPDGRLRWHKWLLSVPITGSIRRSTATANACSTLSALLGAGVPLATALPHCGLATGDRVIAESLQRARQRIMAGEGIASALQAESSLTPTATRLVRIGEETGRLGAMLAHAARVESSHAAERLQRVVRVLEPMLILLFAGVVMIVAAALLQAIYGLRPTT